MTHNKFSSIVILFGFAITLPTNAQSPATKLSAPLTATRLGTASPVLSGQEKSDPLAEDWLRKLLEASGGQERWKGITSARIRVRIGMPGTTHKAERLYLDDWSGARSHYRRGTVGRPDKPHEHEGQPYFTVKTPYGDRILPEFDQAHLLAGNLPAAAASVILKTPKYIVKVGNGTRCNQSQICVEVYRRSGSLYKREEEWLISRESHLPTAIDLFLPQLIEARTVLQEFRFLDFVDQDALKIPSSTDIVAPSGALQHSELVRIHLNASFDKKSFDEELVAK